MLIAQYIAMAATKLEGICDSAQLDAQLLMAHILGVSRNDLLLHHMRSPLPCEILPAFDALLARRVAHEPIAYILGSQEFYGLDLKVSRDVLIPRGDSEALIEAARAQFQGQPAPKAIIDLGTGSGALLLAALSLWPEAKGLGVDISAPALEVARDNARHLGYKDRAQFIQANWHDAGFVDDICRWSQEETGQKGFNLILCNPPYIAPDYPLSPNVVDYEPHQALFAENEGMADYQHLFPMVRQISVDDVVAIFEAGYDQQEKLHLLARENGYDTQFYMDLGNVARAVILRNIAAEG